MNWICGIVILAVAIGWACGAAVGRHDMLRDFGINWKDYFQFRKDRNL